MRDNISIGHGSRTLGRTGSGRTLRIADPVLGAFLARYDRETARLLAMTPGDETLDLGYFDAPYFLFGALTILEPETALRAVAAMPIVTDREQKAKFEAWRQVLRMLGKSTEERWDFLLEKQYGLWVPDKVD